MNALLDTHTLIWAGSLEHKLGSVARAVIFDPENTLVVSAARAWEIATKIRLGKLPEAVDARLDAFGVRRLW